LKELKKHPSLGANTYFNVFTVDSYQGEENDIILLSLVRSNDSLGIGFLESRNRLVVALSRARRGLYLFGNAITLTAAETSEVGIGRDPLWTPVINFMKAQGRFHLDGGFPITCTNHGTTISLMEADEWLGLAGGCDEDCGGILPCGHDCPLKCHPFEHSMVLCRVACPKTMECGHGCSYFCDEACGCTECEKPEDIPADIDYMAPITRDYRGSLSNATGDIRYGSNPSNAGTAGSYSKASSKKVAFSIPGSENQPPYGSGGNSEHGKYDPMPGKSRSGKPSFMNPNVASQRSGAGTAEKWQNWDPKKADADLAEKVRQMEAEQPTVDRSTLVFKDTWRPVVVENGVRSVSGPERKFIRRFGINNQSPAKPGPDTPDDADIADIRSQMTGFSFSHQYPTRAFAAPGLPATDLNDLIGLELSAPPGHAADPGPPPPTGADAASAPRDVVTAPVMMDESENLIDFDDDPSPIFPTPQAALVDLGDLLG
jgi:helicase required for RNAi-mediated heterochromatin assembly 1